MQSCLKLPLSFDPEGLKSDLKNISSDEWVRHFNDRYYEGEWSGVALRAVESAGKRLYSDPGTTEPFRDTQVLARCPSLRRVLAALQCPLKSARLLKLGPAARVIEHRDYNLSLEDGEVRLHIPITTDPLVEFYLNAERVVMLAGECWYINANLPHKVENRSNADRVHLVIDCAVDDWLLSLVASASRSIETTVVSSSAVSGLPSPESLERFCRLVFDDEGLQERLRQVKDRRLFIDLVVRLGEERGCPFNALDVEQAYRRNRRAWIERWV
ncbi:MAG: aspartyl/asparaginyl beta-hydroxylase domain-containing protein [Blastocatellia bacterium]